MIQKPKEACTILQSPKFPMVQAATSILFNIAEAQHTQETHCRVRPDLTNPSFCILRLNRHIRNSVVKKLYMKLKRKEITAPVEKRVQSREFSLGCFSQALANTDHTAECSLTLPEMAT